MKKTRFLRVRDLPAKCRENELRDTFERYGSIQTVRIQKDGSLRHALVAFMETKSAVRATNADNRFNGVPLKVEYCDTFDVSGITVKLPDVSVNAGLADRPCSREQANKKIMSKGVNDTQPLKTNEQSGRFCLLARSAEGRFTASTQSTDQVLRPVQSSVASLRGSFRGLKLSNLPPIGKLSDEHLRQGLFTEFRRCGRIQSIVLPGSNSPVSVNSIEGSGGARTAIVTFRRPEEAESAYQAIRSGDKLLFSTTVVVEHHPGFTGPEEFSSKIVTSGTASVIPGSESDSRLNIDKSTVQNTQANKCPTRTLYVAGLTAGPSGPVTADQLTTAFRKFGDIIDVQLQTSSDSALIQFAEMRGPIRAMNAHSRDPLRLGGRPLHLAYVPSPPSLGLWFSDLPVALASLSDRALIQYLNRLAPILEVTLINRTDPNIRSQPPSATVKPQQQLHYAAYIRLASTEYASQLLTELRSGKHFHSETVLPTSPPNSSAARRPFAVDFASSRQTILVNSLQLNAARSGGSTRIRVISSEKCAASALPSNNQLSNIGPARSEVFGDSLVRSQRNSSSQSSARLPTLPPTSNYLSPGSNANSENSVCCSRTTQINSLLKPIQHNKSISQSSAKQDTSVMQFMQSIDRTRDTSPSSLSTSSTSSSSSSESSSSSVSSSTSSSVTSSTSSASSVHSKPRRALSNASAKSNSVNSKYPKKVNRREKTAQKSVNKSSSKQSVMSPDSGTSPASSAAVRKFSDGQPSPWSIEPSCRSLIRRPLSVMTTVATAMASPARSSAPSSCGLSSPGGSFSSTAFVGLSSNVRTPNGERASEPDALGDHELSTSSVILGQQLSSSTPHTSTTTPLARSFRSSPITQNSTSSASSGVSSGGRSFSSTSSNSSNGSSPLAGGTVTSLQNSGIKSIVTVASSQSKSFSTTTMKSISEENGPLSGTADLVSRSTHLQPATQSWSSDRKSRLYCTEVSSGLKLHLSTNCPSSRSPISIGNSTNNPLTVSIKFNGSCHHDPPGSSLTSPSVLSTQSEVFGSNEDRRCHDTQPLSPLSAPPLNGNSSVRGYTPSTDVGCEKPPSDYAAGGMSTHSTDWLSIGSPVYESMYDKIKRRTNKEAEERRQRQIEATAARDKQRRKRRKKEEKQLVKSPASGTAPCTPPGSFGSEHSVKTVLTNSSSKSHRSKADRSKPAPPLSRFDGLCSKDSNFIHSKNETVLNGRSPVWKSKHHEDRWSHSEDQLNEKKPSHRTCRSHRESLTHKHKRIKRNFSPLSSLSSEDERNSSSPPGTLTRLSLGMRFPVSATYHECVRPKRSPDYKWSADDDNESLGRLSSSLSCSSTDKSVDRFQHKKVSQMRVNSKPNSLALSREHHTMSNVDKLGPSSRSHAASKARSNRKLTSSTKHDDSGSRRTSLSTSDGQTKSSVNNLMAVRCQKPAENPKVNISPRQAKNTYKSLYDSKTEHSLGKKRAHDGMTEFIKAQKKRCTALYDLDPTTASKADSQHLSTAVKHLYESRIRSPHSYGSDDATVLDSETEDIKCSDSVSQTTGVSDYNSLKWSRKRHALGCAAHSGTDDSSLPVTRSPSPLSCRSPTRQGKKHSNRSISCIDDSKSSFDLFMDNDRFSSNSKSTPSTEPMEQMELIERDLAMKFSDDEWHSSVSSTSPHPTNIDFDMDYCPVDRTEQSSTTYQSTSFSSQLLSPVGKLPSPLHDVSDDDSVHIDSGTKLLNAPLEKVETNERERRNSGKSPQVSEKVEPGKSSEEPMFSTKLEDTVCSPPGNTFRLSTLAGFTAGKITSPIVPKIEPELHTVVTTKQHIQSSETSVLDHQPQSVLLINSPQSNGSISRSTGSEGSNSCAIVTAHSEVDLKTENDKQLVIKPAVSVKQDHESRDFSSSGLTTPLSSPLVTKSSPTRPSVSQFVHGFSEAAETVTCVTSSTPLTKVAEIVPSIKVGQLSSETPSHSGTQLSHHLLHTSKRNHTSVSENTKGSPSTLSSMGPPTEVHDITRYVQSVIERVKAEREETQQAAAAAAQYQSPNTSLSSATSSTVVSVHSSRPTPDVSHNAGLGAPAVKRLGNNQRKPLLVATSTCSSVKSASTTTVKVSASCSTTTTPTTFSQSVTSHESAICMMSLNGSVVSSDPLPTATELHVPAIPGVNACTPLTISQPQPMRVTRQSLQQAQLQANTAVKEPDLASTEPSVAVSSVSVTTRRRRRSECRAAISVALENSPAVSNPQPAPTSTDKASNKGIQQTLSYTTVPASSKQSVSSSNADFDTPKTCTQTNIATNVALISTGVSKSQVSVDPYEPNFDDESPLGFDHAHLHHHRSSSPNSASPIIHQPLATASRKHAPISVASVSTSSPVPTDAIGDSQSNSTCPANSVSSVAAQMVASTVVTSATGQPDSVDEVIRDVCAGQFDVESYLNNWRAENQVSTVRTSKCSTGPNPTSAQSAGTIVTPPAMATSVTPTPSRITTTSLSTKSFPIALASEPVVAAVTIPVTSNANSGKSAVPGKNGANNIWNVLNSLLAALQLIPGSQVTVTGPTTAAAVGGIGSGAISATTITLPMNAARQAAANIKAAVLSATNAITPINDTHSAATKKIAPDPSAVEAKTGCPPASNVTEANVLNPPTSSAPPSVVTGPIHPLVSRSETQCAIQSSYPQSVFNSQGSTAPTKVKRLNGPSAKNSRKTPDTLCIETAVAAGISAQSSIPSVLRQPKGTPDFFPAVSRVPLSVPGAQQISVGIPVSLAPHGLTSAPHSASSCTVPSTIQQIHNAGSVSSPFSSLPSPRISSAPSQQQSFGRSSTRTPTPLVSGRSPPLSAPPATNYNIQTLIDRLGGAVEPSVLIALAQAAVSGGTNLCGGVNEAVGRVEAESQLTNYLLRLTQQLNDARSAGIAGGKHFAPASLLDVPGRIVSRAPVSSPAAAPIVSQSTQQQRIALTVPTSVSLTGLSADTVAAVAHSNRPSDNDALISPPITQPRSSSTQPPQLTATSTVFASSPSWSSIGQAYPLVWQGRLSLKNAETRVALHYIYGNPNLLHDCMRLLASGGGGQPQHSLVSNGGPLRIVQRMRLEPAQLEGVQRKIHQEGASCVCLAIPAGNGAVELMQQTQILNDNFIRYMQEKMAAGIINVGFPEFQQGLYVVHIFPPCEFSHTQLDLAAPDLNRRVIQTSQSHLLVVITTV